MSSIGLVICLAEAVPAVEAHPVAEAHPVVELVNKLGCDVAVIREAVEARYLLPSALTFL